MAKKQKYYYTDENGIEHLARTSANEYRWYCYGKCSNNREQVESEKNARIKSLERSLKWAKENAPECVARTEEFLERAKNARVYDLYTK